MTASTDDTAVPARRRPEDWWKSAVVYQVYPRSFADSNGDGIGDLRGIIDRLDYLHDLGIDVLWLSPIYPSPGDDNGYDISDYEDIDPMFGTLVELDELIDGLHRRGMKIVMDLVVNHTSDEHPWFVESRSSRDNPKRDWYWWRPARSGHEAGAPGAEPTNWSSFFSGSTWAYDDITGEYYLHLFSRKQPDLNWENPEVRTEIYAMMRRWLDRGVDGFRMDVINMISKRIDPDGSLPDGVVTGGSRFGDGGPFYLNGPRVHEFMQEMHREVLAGRNLITVAETPGTTVADAVRYTAPHPGEVNMVFTFEHMDLDRAPGGTKWDLAPLRLSDLKANLSAWQEGLTDAGWNSLYWNNHDQPRIVSRWGGDDGDDRVVSAKALGTVLHLLRGTPYVYQGEELGMTNAHLGHIEQYSDIESVRWAAEAAERDVPEESIVRSLAVKSRDNARTPMQWDASENAGFTTGTPWLAVNANHSTINAEAALADPDSVLAWYRALIDLRHRTQVVVHGDYRLLLPADEQVFAYVRAWEKERLLVLVNLSGTAATIDLEADGDLLAGNILLATHRSVDAKASTTPGPIDLHPWESLVVLTTG